MNRRWVQATFRRLNDSKNPCDSAKLDKSEHHNNIQLRSEEEERIVIVDDTDIDISDGLAMEMFGASPSSHEKPRYCFWKTSFGIGLWLTRILSMVAARSASLVVATNADTKALLLVTENITTNLESSLLGILKTGVLEWGNKEHTESIKGLASGGFEVNIGTDVTYVAEAIIPLFRTAKELISLKMGDSRVQEKLTALILCHVFRRVDEPSLLSAASMFGFKLADRWAVNSRESFVGNIIDRWFLEQDLVAAIPSSALRILYFRIE